MFDTIDNTEATTVEEVAMQKMAEEIIVLKEQVQALTPKVPTDATPSNTETKPLEEKLKGMSYNQIVKLAKNW